MVGNGSAMRTEKAPGHLDERAEAFDAALGASLRAGRPAVDVDLARELWASVDAMVELGELDATWARHRSTTTTTPFGVQYWVMRWTSRLSELSDADLDELYAVESRPWLRVNMISTVDGAATGPDGRSGGINNAADKRVFDTLRRLCDAVVVGAGTARDEGYRPFTKPLVLVSRSGEVPVPASRRPGRLGADGDLCGGGAPRRDSRAAG